METEIENKPTEAVAEKPPHPWSKFNSEFLVIEEVMTLADAARKRAPGFRLKKCLIMRSEDLLNASYITGNWKKGNGDSVRMINHAEVYTVHEAMDMANHVSRDFQIALLNEEILAKRPRQRSHEIEKLLNPTLVEMMRTAPENPTLRSHLTVLYNTPPPVEAKTYAALKDWAELEFKSPSLDGMKAVYAMPREKPKPTYFALTQENPTAPQAPQAGGLTIGMQKTERVQGTCCYVSMRRSYGEYTINADRVMGEISNGYSLQTTVERLAAVAYNTNRGWHNEEEIGDVDYQDYAEQRRDRRTHQMENQDRVRADLVEFIRSNYGAQAEEIINR